MQVVRWGSAPAATQPYWVWLSVALGRMGGERAAGRVSPPERRGSWKAPARRAGLRMLDVRKGKTQGNREISKMG